jgi:hypothetical protein
MEYINNANFSNKLALFFSGQSIDIKALREIMLKILKKPIV